MTRGSFHGEGGDDAGDVEEPVGERLVLGDQIMAMFESVMGSGCYIQHALQVTLIGSFGSRILER